MFSSFNAFLRTVILAGLLGVAGWWTLLAHDKLSNNEEQLNRARQEVDALSMTVEERDRAIRKLGVTVDEKNRRIGALEEGIAERDEKIEMLDVAMRLLKVDTRVAKMEVLSQGASGENPERMRTVVRFHELGPRGEPIGEGRVITVEGKTVYVESLVVKFDDSYVEQGDELRGTSICLFKRIFGENQQPSEGEALDPVGQQPLVYAGDDTPNPVHDEIWRRFWDYANDPELSRELGIRAIHGEAPFVEARPGKTYHIELRSSDGLTIRPAE